MERYIPGMEKKTFTHYILEWWDTWQFFRVCEPEISPFFESKEFIKYPYGLWGDARIREYCGDGFWDSTYTFYFGEFYFYHSNFFNYTNRIFGPRTDNIIECIMNNSILFNLFCLAIIYLIYVYSKEGSEGVFMYYFYFWYFFTGITTFIIGLTCLWPFVDFFLPIPLVVGLIYRALYYLTLYGMEYTPLVLDWIHQNWNLLLNWCIENWPWKAPPPEIEIISDEELYVLYCRELQAHKLWWAEWRSMVIFWTIFTGLNIGFGAAGIYKLSKIFGGWF